MDVLASSCARPRSSRSTAATSSLARSGSGLAAVAAAGAELFKGRGGAGGVQKTVEILQVPFVVVLRFSSSTECAPLRVNKNRYPQELQFLDKVVERSRVMQRQVLEGIRTPTRSWTCQWSCVSLRVLERIPAFSTWE